MSEHTPGKLEVLDDRRISVTLPSLIEGCGYSSHCVALTFGGDARVNSHANARRLVAAWNACEGLDTELLENIVMTGDTIKSRFDLRTKEERAMVAEADSLRAVNAELMEALEDAATSLETINRLAGKANYGVDDNGPIPTYMGHHDEVRGYAGSRAGVARAAIASARKQKGEA